MKRKITVFITTLIIISTFVIDGLMIGGTTKVAAFSLGRVSPSGSDGKVSSQAINAAFNSKASNLRLQTNNLLREHAALGALTLTALYEGADTTGLMQQMNANESQLAAVVQNVYGTSGHNTFVELWTQHMQEYQNYTIAKKNNDTAKMNAAKQHLQTIANKLGSIFAGSNQNTSAIVSNAMMDHMNGTLAIVDALSHGNATQSAVFTKAGYDQAGSLADVVTRAMILHNPSMFSQ